jgi:TonB-dependent SusC/RagA subfamily outer membrane receptor
MLRRLVVVAGSVVAALLVFAEALAAQTGVLSGVIYDQSNKTGLAGAEVRIKGTQLTAVTGSDGRFTIANVPVGTQVLEAVRTGYRPYRLPAVRIANPDTVHVYLALSAMGEASADETWSIGHSVLRDVVTTGTTHTSVGEVSANAPLYVVDGVLLSAGTIAADIDPSRIESVEVIKGEAAASLYGSKATNGVIVITTRRPPD